MAGKMFNRDVRISGGGALYVNEIKVIDENGNIDAPVTTTDLTTTGTTTLGETSGDTVTINGAQQVNSTITVGVDGTGKDVKFFGDTASAYMLWDESADKLILAGAGALQVAGTTTLGVTNGSGALTNTIADIATAAPSNVRSIIGQVTNTTTMTSGLVTGVRGLSTVASASGGFIYGTQGKLAVTGTLSGSVWAAGLFGQLDLSAATLNAGQVAAIWGDYGATSGTETDTTGARGIAMTNTTDAVLNAQDYRYGNATYLLELAGAGGTLNYYIAAGTGAGSAGKSDGCAAQQVIKIVINGTAAYIPVFTQNT